MVDWTSIDVSKIEVYCKAYYDRYGDYPSLRDLFYRFVDELWPNTSSVYKRLSVFLRDKRIDKKIDWHVIRDGAGREFEDNDWTYHTPREHVDIWLTLFTEIGSRYRLPMWVDQPNIVAVVCEKEADYPIIKSVTSELNVDTAYVRGYSGWRLFFEMLEKYKPLNKEVIIIALADFDPSGGEGAKKTGKDLVSFILKALDQLGLQAQVKKVAVTKEQIERFKLPHRPEDEKEIRKLQRDPRFKTWPYGLYRVETAALRAKAPDYFDKLIKDAVQEHFDQEIYKKIQEKETELQQNIEDFFDEHEDLIDELREAIRDDPNLD